MTFEEHRAHLTSVAYRMLGTMTDAEDAVQETYLRWHDAEQASIKSPRAWLITVVTRICIDTMRSASVRREEYVGPWLPEPVLTDSDESPLDKTELAESISMALMRVLEQLTPAERAAFLLHETFDHPYHEIARILDKTEANCRQLVSRAKKHVARERPRFDATSEERDRLMRQFTLATQSGDMHGLVDLFAEDIVLWSDGGGKQKAALRPIYGPDKVARFLFGLAKKLPPGWTFEAHEINGEVGFVGYVFGQPILSTTFEIGHGRIHGIHIVNNPEKLRYLARTDQ